MRARSSRTSAPTVCRDLPELLARWDVGFMPFALNDATRHISPTKTPDFWPLGYRWFRRRFWTLSEPTGKLAWLELQPLLRTSFWKSKAHCANPRRLDSESGCPPCHVLVGLNVAIHGQRYSQHWPRVRKQETPSTQTQPRRRRPVPSRPDSAAAAETATIV